ncbi:hypothetical protein [Muricoccus radiodurans]|uniref:hypothetical protein n=1 Tax=Muricoccus radiodurans TaxID=2231721 RepID=UPI003CF11AA2
MPSVKRAKTAFTAGELAPELLGRGDIAAWGNGAARLRNVFIQPTGGVQRRPGLRHLQSLPGPARLAPFEISTDLTHLLVFRDRALRVFRGDDMVVELPAPWTGAMLPQLAWTQDAHQMIVLHPDMRPQYVTFTFAAGWSVTPFAFLREPFIRYAPAGVIVSTNGTSGAVTLNASDAVFRPGHVGSRLRVEGCQVLVTNFINAASLIVQVEEELTTTGGAANWDESIFSDAYGWPVSACFHQNRLVFGGSRALPNQIWFSRTGDRLNFDLGEGLDDQAISFALAADGVNAIRAVFPGRHLQVFTSGAEWMVTGDPLTPASIQVARQTRVGSITERMVPPVDVDGTTIFAARSGRAVHEFSYTEVQGAYQAADLALAARHLVQSPVSMAYDATRRLLHLAMADGGLSTLTLYRGEGVTGWTRQETAGAFRGIAEVEGTVYALVERAGTHRLERFDDAMAVDGGVSLATPAGAYTWGGLSHLEGQTVAILADGASRGTTPVSQGTVTLDPYATTLQAGLAFTHVVEPLPPETAGSGGARTGPVRLVSATFRLLGAGALTVDLGRGAQPVPFRRLDTPMLDAAPPAFTGDVTLRGLGWRNGIVPLWRIESDAPLPFTLLSVTTETRITD